MPKKSSGMQKILFLNRISPQKINKPKIPFYFTVYTVLKLQLYFRQAKPPQVSDNRLYEILLLISHAAVDLININYSY